MNNIGKTIKKIREEKNITQEQLAEKLNVTRQAVSNWENGKTQPDIDTIIKISEILEVSVEEIIYGQKKITNEIVTNKSVKIGTQSGIGFGAALAMIISYVKWQSIGWAILHGILNWIYVIYFIVKKY
ncbi:MAG: helix-turn-helix domain-containing protein [Oscillospiraceae bacterium]|nr:helix-turn-helix domain-containing protein [Oscillospiraceae bacterium]